MWTNLDRLNRTGVMECWSRWRDGAESDWENVLHAARGDWRTGGGVTRDKHAFTEGFAFLGRDKGVTRRDKSDRDRSSGLIER
jgi:hypothetical protein